MIHEFCMTLGLKIPRPQGREGSNPSCPTYEIFHEVGVRTQILGPLDGSGVGARFRQVRQAWLAGCHTGVTVPVGGAP